MKSVLFTDGDLSTKNSFKAIVVLNYCSKSGRSPTPSSLVRERLKKSQKSPCVGVELTESNHYWTCMTPGVLTRVHHDQCALACNRVEDVK